MKAVGIEDVQAYADRVVVDEAAVAPGHLDGDVDQIALGQFARFVPDDEQALGDGSTFEIYLPKSQDNDFQADADTITIDQGNLSILFVEDDEDQLNSVPRILREMGHTVIAIQDPIIAIEQAQLQKDAIDVIISDYDMPAMNGTQLAKTLEDFPIILVSGREDAIIAAKKQPNIIKTIIKPYDKQDLKVALGTKYDKE